MLRCTSPHRPPSRRIAAKLAEPRRGGARATAADVAADVLLEYLEAAVYCTLCRRGVYPPELFELQRLYGIPVQRARSPALLEYLADFLDALRPMVLTGAAKAVCVVITSEEPALAPLERHVFGFELVGDAASAAAELAAKQRGEKRAHPPAASDADKEALVRLDRLLAEAVSALGGADAWLQPLPPECTFRLDVLTSDYSDDRAVFWLTQEEVEHAPAGLPPLGPRVVPVHSLGAMQRAPLLRLSVLAEDLQQRDMSQPYEEAYPVPH